MIVFDVWLDGVCCDVGLIFDIMFVMKSANDDDDNGTIISAYGSDANTKYFKYAMWKRATWLKRAFCALFFT